MISRRQLLKLTAGSCIGISALGLANSTSEIHRRIVPSSGEEIPTIGMGTWITFNVGNDSTLRHARCAVLDQFFKLGGVLVDSSPMYGSAEEVVGFCASRLSTPPQYFPTTKVWTSSEKEGQAQIENSFRLWQTKGFGLFQVHNLVNWESHLDYLDELKHQGTIRYTGVTTSHGRRHDELEKIMLSRPVDFIQLTYNLQDREAEQRLLPLAANNDIAVIVNRPFRRGALFDRIADQALPSWAGEIDCQNMAQIMLKFVVSHLAVTCAIPATSQVPHMIENMGAMRGPIPDRAMRKKILDWFNRI